MHPPLINFPQLPKLHKSWCSHLYPIWKKYEFFSPQTVQNSLSSSSIKRWSIGKKEERKRCIEKKWKEEKLQKSLFRKGNSIFWEEKTFSKLFSESIFSPSILPLQKPFSKSFENSWLFWNHPLAWQYTWLELHFFLCLSSTYLSFRW
jgi:hypothetical protein